MIVGVKNVGVEVWGANRVIPGLAICDRPLNGGSVFSVVLPECCRVILG